MAKRPRRNHGAVFKAKVALEAIKGKQTLGSGVVAGISGSSEPDSSVEETIVGSGCNYSDQVMTVHDVVAVITYPLQPGYFQISHWHP